MSEKAADGIFELYDRKRLRIVRMPTDDARKCPDETSFLQWLISQGAPADVRLHSRTRGDHKTTGFVVWSGTFEPVPEGELIPPFDLLTDNEAL
jgi:hypothetical protein